jgi:hypothetical protein
LHGGAGAGPAGRAEVDFIHPPTAYFIVREIALNQFSMTDIRVAPRAGCPKMGCDANPQ